MHKLKIKEVMCYEIFEVWHGVGNLIETLRATWEDGHKDDNDEGGEETSSNGLVPPFVFLVIKLTRCALTYPHMMII